ncbi:MAG: electron transfer flavoprotein beta subunit/FixA family protein [Chloroflexota bacterium]|nr:MAG: electron transfer flavoprotein beta subunit/FixA family protein [Chloroflexota bacterium]
MNIIVCVKQVLDIRRPLVAENDCFVRQQSENQTYIVNPVDRCALEEALSIRRQAGQGKVTAVTVGNDRARQALYYCLAQGANDAIHVCQDVDAILDSHGVAEMLSKLIDQLTYDLILCGNASLDTNNSQTGAILAEFLNLPHVRDVVNIQVSQERQQLSVRRRLEKGKREDIECPLPAVLSVDRLINQPRYVSVHSYQAAMKRRLTTASDLGINAFSFATREQSLRVTKVTLPRPRPKKSQSLDASLSGADRLKMLMGGGATSNKKSNVLKGEPEQLAAKVIEYLQSEGLAPLSQS